MNININRSASLAIVAAAIVGGVSWALYLDAANVAATLLTFGIALASALAGNKGNGAPS